MKSRWTARIAAVGVKAAVRVRVRFFGKVSTTDFHDLESRNRTRPCLVLADYFFDRKYAVEKANSDLIGRDPVVVIHVDDS